MGRILIVDDEIDLLDILLFNLEKNGFEVDTARSGEEALETLAGADEYSLILLDVMMRGIDGFETARRLRANKNKTPIIFLTAMNTEESLLQGFAAGGDDYISKPFSVKEVMARVKAVMARVPQKSKRLTAGILTIDPESRTVTVAGEAVNVTKTEFAILETLMRNSNRYLSRDELYSLVWPDDQYGEVRTVDVHIARLRKKLLSAATLIINRSGYGYRIADESSRM